MKPRRLPAALGGLAALLILAARPFAAGPDTEATAYATVTVATVFSIEVDPVFVSLGLLQPDGRSNDFPGVSVLTVRSNAGGRFFVKARSGTEVPGAALSVRARSAREGSRPGPWVELASADAVAYASSAAEGRGNLPGGTSITLDVRATAAPAATPSPKAWTVTLTLVGYP